jgi:purine-binding chemotaxis protein CheW
MNLLAVKNKLQILHFQVQDIYLCLELKYIEQVLPLVLLRNIPDCPNYVAGLLNVGGRSIPVIDLIMRLGFERKDKYTLTTPIILCGNEDQQIGFIVDNINGIDEIDRNLVQERQEFKKPYSAILGIVTLNEKISLLINIHPLLKDNLIAGEQNE